MFSGHSIPIDFWVNDTEIANNGKRTTLLGYLTALIEKFFSLASLNQISDVALPGDHYMTLYASPEVSLSVKQYKEGLVSATLEHLVNADVGTRILVTLEDMHELERKLISELRCLRAKVLPAIKRAPKVNPYFTSSDDRLLEYDVDRIAFEQKTDFQKVQIVHTKSFGNVLILDDLQNLAESDLAYTHGLMNKGVDTYKEKEVLILGGGDGALLYELLQEEPKFVTMIDIDEAVILSCRKHLRSVCQNVMDKYEGDRYKIIIGDAIQHMRDYLNAGKEFDYVFGDLTDVPISKTARGEHWDFMRSILNLGTKLLKPGTGRYMTHAIGEQCKSALEMFESQIDLLETGNTFERTSCYVPSFMEKWCFYQITRKSLPR